MYPKIGMYSAINGAGEPLLNKDHTLNPETIALQARYDHVILDAHAPKHRPDIVSALRAANPNIQLLGYVMGAVWWQNPHPALGPAENDLPWHYFLAVQATEGFVFDTTGNRIPGAVNTSKLETMLAIADVLIQDVVLPGLWDGLLIDVTCPGAYSITGRTEEVDMARLGFANIPELDRACRIVHKQFIDRIRSQCPEGFSIVGNCGPSGEPSCNGWMRENFPYQNAGPFDDPWYANMFGNQYGYPGYLNETYTVPQQSWLVSQPGYSQDSEESKRHMRFGLGTACLAGGVHSFGRHEWEPRRFWWYPEYDNKGRGKGWLGEALRPYKPLSNGAFMREFVNGAVIVNPSGTARSTYLADLYRPVVSGAWKRAFSIPARDALFLIR